MYQRSIRTILIAVLVLMVSAVNLFAQKLTYNLSFPEPQAHYCTVAVRMEGLNATQTKKGFVDFKMPTWAPGSYLIREFARHVEGETAATGSGEALKVEKVTKNTWRIYTGKATDVVFTYKVYAYELTVRTSFIDASHAYLNGTSIFVYPDGLVQLPSTLTIKPHADWKEISTGLSPVGSDKWVLASPNYDILADSPIEIGNQKLYRFDALGIPHTIAVYGYGNYNEKTFTADVKTIVEEATKVFGENPVKNYTFIVQNQARGGGGLEHLNSTSLVVGRFSYGSATGYQGWLSLVAHEYFHLWNVKRLRPKPLGPFDYENENYTRLLWVSEGITSYYDNLLVRRAGLMDENAYLRLVADNIQNHENSPGSKVQSAGESSFDAWIKGYRTNENSRNSTISYYGAGATLGSMLDLEILGSTGGQKSLDDVMKYMYEEYYKKQNRGFTEEEFQKAAELMAGKKLDDFFKSVYATAPIDYNKYLAYAGLKLDVSKDNAPSLGIATAEENGKVIIKGVTRGTAGYTAGLNVNDELIAIDNVRTDRNVLISQYLETRAKGDKVSVLVNRDGLLQTIQVTIGDNGNSTYRFARTGTPTEEQKRVYARWTGGKI